VEQDEKTVSQTFPSSYDVFKKVFEKVKTYAGAVV